MADRYQYYLTDEQASDLLQHLVKRLAASGLSHVNESIQESLALLPREQDELVSERRRDSYPRTPKQVLFYYLNGTIEYIRHNSSQYVPQIITQINEHLSQDKIGDIVVRYDNLENENTEGQISLLDLPDYSKMLETLSRLRQNLRAYDNG